MRTLEVLIEQNALGTVRPMQLVAQSPVSALLPAIVEELQLPRTDLFGNRLVYFLRLDANGPALRGDRSLEAAGIKARTKLALDSYAEHGSLATVRAGLKDGQLRRPEFYSSITLADAPALHALDLHTSAALPVVRPSRKRSWTRRSFLLLGSAVLGAGSVCLGYAGYTALRYYLTGKQLATNTGTSQAITGQRKQAPTTALIPTSAQAVLVFTQHTQAVRTVAWSSDGLLLASGANDAQVLVWNTSGAVQTRQQLSGQVRAVAWSPDGTLLAASAMNRLAWFNAQTGAQLAQSRHTHTGTITTLAWSPQAPYRLVSGATDMKAIVWDSTAFQPQEIFTGHTTPIESASWAADNQEVGTASHGGTVRVWSASSGQEIHAPYLDAGQPMRALAFNHATNVLAVGADDGIVRLWNGLVCQQPGQGQGGMQCLDMPARITPQDGVIHALAWSPDGRFLATGGDGGALTLWYPAQRLSLLLNVHHDDPVLALAWSPDGKRIAAASGNNVILWELHP